MEDRETYEAIWEELKLIGYQDGDDVLYFHFIEAYDYSNVNYFDINIEELEEAMGVNVGYNNQIDIIGIWEIEPEYP